MKFSIIYINEIKMYSLYIRLPLNYKIISTCSDLWVVSAPWTPTVKWIVSHQLGGTSLLTLTFGDAARCLTPRPSKRCMDMRCTCSAFIKIYPDGRCMKSQLRNVPSPYMIVTTNLLPLSWFRPWPILPTAWEAHH